MFTVGQQITLKNRYFDGYSWREEELSATVETVNTDANQRQYGTAKLYIGIGMSWFDDNGQARHR